MGRRLEPPVKHAKGAATRLLTEMKDRLGGVKKQGERKELGQAITYFTNPREQIGYWRHIAEGLPIGSGVTEAACKALIKQRLGCSGMRWKGEGTSAVIALRSLELTEGRWDQFWRHVEANGVLE